MLRPFDLRRGELVAIVGPNGAGKTTLLNTLAGLHKFCQGDVTLDGRPVRSYHPAERARTLALMVSEPTAIEGISVRDVVAMGRFPHHRWWEWNELEEDQDGIAAALSAVRMQHFSGRAFGTLSTGERQRVWLALALAQATPALLLDEPTSHLDVRVSQEILQLLVRQAHLGKLVVCVLHDVNEALAFADRIFVLGDGTILGAGRPQEILDAGALDAAYGINFEVLRSAGDGLRVFPAGPLET